VSEAPGRPKQASAPSGGSEPRAAGSVGAASDATDRPEQARTEAEGTQANGFGGIEVPFIDHLGIVLTRFAGGESELHYEAKPEHLNNFAVTHGGACMTLLDVSMATAARSLREDFGVVTIEMKTSFLQPARGPLRALGSVLHHTGRMAFTESRIIDEQGRVCAHATGTFKYVPRSPTTHQLPSD
jgi:uncharacterized protein (TIGR00369 family)